MTTNIIVVIVSRLQILWMVRNCLYVAMGTDTPANVIVVLSSSY